MRPAADDDAAFLALAMQEADRGHTGIGSWDVMFPGPEHGRLEILAALARATPRSFVHSSTFLVAEVDGEPAGTVAGYVPRLTPSDLFVAACREVLGDEATGALEPSGAWSREYFSVEIPPDTLRVEWVYTAPAARGRGVCRALLERLLDAARARGIGTAHVGTYLGNDPAVASYLRAGFDEFAECRHADYERRFHAPGLVFLRRHL